MFIICFMTSIVFGLQDVETTPQRVWRTPTEIAQQLETLDTSNESVSITTIGFSKNGIPIQCLQIARNGEVPIEDRSAILVVAGIDGNHLLGTEVATDLIDGLLSMDVETTKVLLETHKLYIIPQVNPDAASYYFAPVQNGQRRNMRPTDNDHDGVVDEDGNEDLNGDGFITMMRVPDLEKATHLADPDEPRLDIKPDAFEGQVASFVLYSEGIDNDEDGKFNEDGIGGVDLNKNFMHGYQIHSDGAGPWQLSESESKALVDFVLGHQEIATILVYGHHDTLSKAMGENGKDVAGAPKKLDSGDIELYKRISERFNELTSLKNTEQSNWDGSFVAWAYAQYGVPSFSTPLWSRPEPQKEESTSEEDPKEESDAESTQDDTSSGRSEGRGEGGRHGFDREAMMAEFDTDGDGELNDDERSAFRESMRERFGGRGGGGRGGGRPSGERPSGRGGDAERGSEGDSDLTPSGVGDISQETLDELYQAAIDAGYPVSEADMAEITPEQVEQYAKMSGVKIRRVKSGKTNEKSSTDDVAWLAYSDDQRNGEGFIEWKPFEHPQLGTVEIGGWVPYFKTLPPTDVIADTTTSQVKFLIDLASKLPDVHLGEPIVEKLGNGLWELKIAVSNDGWFPSGTAMAKRNKRARPYVVRLEVPNETIVSGQKVNRIWSLEGGGTRKWYKWILQGKPNSKVNITLYSEKFGSETISTTLKTTTGGGA